LEATFCYLKAEQWQEAHNVLANHLFANYLLQKSIGYLKSTIFSQFKFCVFLLDGQNTLKHLLSWLIDGSTINGSIPTTLQDSLTMLEYLNLNDNLSKMSVEKSIMHIALLCDRVSCLPEITNEER